MIESNPRRAANWSSHFWPFLCSFLSCYIISSEGFGFFFLDSNFQDLLKIYFHVVCNFEKIWIATEQPRAAAFLSEYIWSTQNTESASSDPIVFVLSDLSPPKDWSKISISPELSWFWLFVRIMRC